jgi:hypothetical protein
MAWRRMIGIELGEVIMAATTFDAAHRLEEPLPAQPDSFERATSRAYRIRGKRCGRM